FPTRVRATGQGFSYNFGRIIAAGGVLSMGFLMSEKVFHGSYPQAGATISLIYAAVLVAVWLAPETRGKPLPEEVTLSLTFLCQPCLKSIFKRRRHRHEGLVDWFSLVKMVPIE